MANIPPRVAIAGDYHNAFEQFYCEVDPSGSGIVDAKSAAAFLKRSGLDTTTLSQIWEVADYTRAGALDKTGFFVALKLVALAQNAMAVSVDALQASTPAPVFTGGSANVEWLIVGEELQKYRAIFESLGPVGGRLAGDKVKPVLLNSGLSANVLGKIWDLSDIDRDGQLDADEMCVALHLVYRALENDTVPPSLPTPLVPPSKRHLLGSAAGGALDRRTSLPIGGVQVLPIAPPSANARVRAASVTAADAPSMGGYGEFGGGSGAQSPAMPRGRSTSTSSAGGTSRSLSATPVPTGAPWLVDRTRFDALFRDADTDRDGVVSGADVRQILIDSGLSQTYLAHIWALVDMKQTGRLNVEQFALAMHLIDAKKCHNVEPPAALPPELIPPSMRPPGHEPPPTAAAQMDVSAARQSSGNKEVDELMSALDGLQLERRRVEASVVQFEADMTVKHSEIKNLEIELNTLDSTVKQLERQKAEAGRRLGDIDCQTAALRQTLDESRRALAADEADVQTMRDQLSQSSASARSEEDELNRRREELHALREQERLLEVQLQNEKANLDTVVQQYGSVERDMQQTEGGLSEVRNQTRVLQDRLDRLEQLIQSGDVAAMLKQEAALLSAVEQLNLDTGGTPNNWQGGVGSPQQTSTPHVAVDPFQQGDPFASSAAVADPFAHDDPFATGGGGGAHFDDPFGGAVHDPFGGGDPFVSTADSHAPPPRPAPPKNRPVTPARPADPFSSAVAAGSDDPWGDGGGQQAAGGGGFANFADFDKFG